MKQATQTIRWSGRRVATATLLVAVGTAAAVWSPTSTCTVTDQAMLAGPWARVAHGVTEAIARALSHVSERDRSIQSEPPASQATQPDSDQPIGEGFDQPLHGDQDGGIQEHHTIHIVTTDGTDRYEVHVENGRVEAKLNGEPLPPERIRVEDGVIVLLNAQGREVGRFHTRPMNDRAWADAWRELMWNPFAGNPRMPGDFVFMTQPQSPPRVMLGVTMSEPDPAVRQYLGLEEGSSILLSRVMPGLPAAKAGLQDGDIIVEIDGQRPASPARLREVLAARNPGDELPLRILRRGESKRVVVKLEPYDPARLGLTPPDRPDVQARPDRPPLVERFPEFAEAQRNLERALKQLSELKIDREELRQELRESLEEAIEALRRAERDAFRHLESLRGGDRDTLRNLEIERDTQRRMLGVPPEGGPERMLQFMVPGRVEQLERRLGELNARFDRLERKLDDLEALLRRMQEH